MLTTHIRTRGLRPGVKGFRVSIVQPKLQLQLVFPLWPKQFGARCIKTHKCRCCCKKKSCLFIYIHTCRYFSLCEMQLVYLLDFGCVSCACFFLFHQRQRREFLVCSFLCSPTFPHCHAKVVMK